MTERLSINSHRGPYAVEEELEVAGVVRQLLAITSPTSVIVAARGAQLHHTALAPLFARVDPLLIDATEENKSLARMQGHVEGLMRRGVRRDHVLVAIGGGILQDITCFLASTLFRGMTWEFVPTTLLAQADSCIGSKSSINVGVFKNLMGTFVPPRRIVMSQGFLETLDDDALRSGIGEILKVHILDGQHSLAELAQADLVSDRAALSKAIWRSLTIKQRYIEADEFDQNVRNVLNYGHSFGHAIESATEFAVPHGIAVTIGMDLANHVSAALGALPIVLRDSMHKVLVANAGRFVSTPVPIRQFFEALGRDKKNVGDKLAFILLDEEARAHKVLVQNDAALHATCSAYFESVSK